MELHCFPVLTEGPVIQFFPSLYNKNVCTDIKGEKVFFISWLFSGIE